MARDCNGCEMSLERAPLKYAGLDPWEILLSEAQERMTLAVPPGKIDRFMEMAGRMEVEATIPDWRLRSAEIQALVRQILAEGSKMKVATQQSEIGESGNRQAARKSITDKKVATKNLTRRNPPLLTPTSPDFRKTPCACWRKDTFSTALRRSPGRTGNLYRRIS
jgi:hypothetical protein